MNLFTFRIIRILIIQIRIINRISFITIIRKVTILTKIDGFNACSVIVNPIVFY